MDLDDIRIFTKVAEAGSFTKAAKTLDIPKSTVSRRVSELEDNLGSLLLQRTTRKLTLTPAGEIYFARTQRIISELHDAQVALEEMQDTPRGWLRITTPSDMNGLIPRLTGEFQKKFPDVQICVFATGRRVDLVAEGYDLALRAGRLADSSMVSKKLLSTRFGLFASADYLKERGTPCTPEELLNHDCLCCTLEGTPATWKMKNGAKAAEVLVNARLTSNDFSVLRVAAVYGQGIASLPFVEGVLQVKSGELVRVLPEYELQGGGLYAVYPSARHPSPRVRAFIDFTSEWMSRLDNLEQ